MFKRIKLTHTMTLNPKLGIMGFLGFIGFISFIPEINGQEKNTFLFFIFFGFFSFYYIGKMSNTFIDERFEKNKYRADAISLRVGFLSIIMVFILIMTVLKIKDSETILNILMATISFSFGIVIFLQSYLLYRFENEE
ncbi:MAG: DUF3796 domain-containing protein [Lachnospirales bacterium]